MADHDLIVIGGGAAGMSAAREGRRLGASVLLVSEGPLGGECLYTGCVPSKALIAAGAAGESFAQGMARVRASIEQIAATEDDDTLRAEGIEVLHERARLAGDRGVEIAGSRRSARGVVIATGAGPAVPGIPGLSALAPLTNEDVFELEQMPASLAVLGGGPIGCELAQAFARLGVRVTLLEQLPRLLPGEEPEASEVVATALSRDGVDVRTGVRVERAEAGGEGAALAGDGWRVEAERVLVAAGRVPRTDGLDLEAAGVEQRPGGYVKTDDRLATAAPGVYAVGDVTGRMAFTHAAALMGRIAAGNALRRRGGERFDPTPIPWVTFTQPEVARVGMLESEAVEHGGRVAELPMARVDRAIVEGQTDGFVKLIVGPRGLLRNAGGGRVLGATIVAARGGEMIHEPALAMRANMFAGRLAQATHAYPTWSIAVQMAAAQLFVEIDGRTARPARAEAPAEPAPAS